MFQRLARLRLIAMLGGLLLTAACTAQSSSSGAHAASGSSPDPYTEGSEYVTLPGPAQRYSNTGKVEVVEVFSYGCVHCAHFAPIAEAMKKQLPAGVEFKLMPAVFNDEWMPFARAYYAAKKLGVLEQTHLALFKAKFEENYPINTLDELADYYARQGVNRAEFLRIANSEDVSAQLKNDFDLAQKWGVPGTPTIVVNGKYRTAEVHTQEELSALTIWLAKRELAAQKGH